MKDCHITVDDDMEYRNIILKKGGFEEVAKEELLKQGRVYRLPEISM